MKVTRLLGRPEPRGPELRTLVEGSLSLARTELSDEEAVEQLRAGDPSDDLAGQAIKILQKQRDAYVGDRAFRLVEAACGDGTVRPPEPDRRELFSEERALGCMPVKDAFEQLERSVPGLNDLRLSVVDAEPGEWVTPVLYKTAELLGPDSSSAPVGLARTRLASLVAMAYLSALSGDTRRGDINTPYFVICERPAAIEVKRAK